MDRGTYQRLKSLFDEALALPADARDDFLVRTCADDAELLESARAMLAAADRESDDALDRALGDEPARPELAAMPERIAGYRITGVAGHGGMGTVYEAEQEAPRRRVALKVVQATRLRDVTLRRFRREVEILGRLRHPAIAQVFEAGEFELNGVTLPFFAMEFVEGPDLLTWATRRQLDGDARIELFCRVCDAVQHAHEHGIVHRDLKPDNVLVVGGSDGGGTPSGQPKILDFGVARVLDSDLQATLSTDAGQLLGSVPYMSPEQAAADPTRVIDPRSDVYALGVLLFELLGGRMPYDVTQRPLAEALRTIQERDPLRLGAVDPALRGDLETIAGRCLEKDPARRYESAAALAADLRRHREHRPIAARPPSTWHQLVRFTRRHRAFVGGTAAALLALTAGLVVAIVFALRAADSEELARRESVRARLAAADALSDVDPLAARRALDNIPAGARGWEWRHLDAQLTRHVLEFGAWFPGSPLVPVDDGARLFAGRDAHTLALWDLATGLEAATWAAPGEVSCWGVSDDGALLAAGLAEGDVFVTRRDDPDGWTLWLDDERPASEIVFSPDGARLAVLQASWLLVGDARGWARAEIPEGQKAPRVRFHPDGDTLLVSTRRPFDARLWVRDAHDLSVLAERYTPEPTLGLALSADGDVLVVGTEQRGVNLYDSASLEPLGRRTGHTQWVDDVAGGPGGMLVSAARDDTLRVWDDRGDALAVLSHPDVQRAVFATDERLVSAGADGLRLWDLAAGSRRVHGGHASYVYELAFAPDGNRLVAHSPFGQELSVWDVLGGRLLARWPAEGHAVDVVWGADGRVALGGHASRRVLDWASGAEGLASAPRPWLHMLYMRSRDDRELVVGDARTAWSDTDRGVVFRTEHGLHADGSHARAFADGRPLAASSRDSAPAPLGAHPALRIGSWGAQNSRMSGWLSDLLVYDGWLDADEAGAVEACLAARRDGDAHAALPTVRGARLVARFHADRDSVVHGAADANGRQPVSAWRASAGRELVLRAAGGPAGAIHFVAAGDGLPDRVVLTQDPRDRRWLEAPLPAVRHAEQLTVFWLGAYADEWPGTEAAAYALGSDAGALGGWTGRDPDNGRLGVAHSRSRDGRLDARGLLGVSGSVAVRDARTGELRAQFDSGYSGLAFDPAGERLACGQDTGRVDVWDTSSLEGRYSGPGHDGAEPLASWPAHEGGATYAVAWSPDGTRIATGGNDNIIRLWDAATYELLLELRGHRQYVKAVAFSPDGTLLASASGDGSVRLWDSLPPATRFAQALAGRRQEAAVRPQVLAWLGELPDRAAVAARIRATWPDDPASRDAALDVLALTPVGD